MFLEWTCHSYLNSPIIGNLGFLFTITSNAAINLFYIALTFFFIWIITLGQIPKSQITGTKCVKIEVTLNMCCRIMFQKDRPIYNTWILVGA